MSGHFLMIWFRKDSLDTVGFRTFGGSRAVLSNSNRGILHVFQEIAIYRTKKVKSPKPKSDILSPNCAYGTGLGVSPTKYHFLPPSLNRNLKQLCLNK